MMHLKQKKKNQKKNKKKNQKRKEPKNFSNILRFFKYIESIGINYNLFKEYFNFVAPTVLAKELFKTKYKNNE